MAIIKGTHCAAVAGLAAALSLAAVTSSSAAPRWGTAAAVGAGAAIGAAAATSAPYYGTYDYAPGYAGYYDYAPARPAGAAWGPSWWEQPYPPGCGAGKPHC